MTYLAARLFDYLQGADFYRSLHQTAANLVQAAPGSTWLDAGCGPGLFARIAAARGFTTLGIDQDADMIRLAQRNDSAARANYATRSLAEAAGPSALFDVVSASSLLVTSGQPVQMLQELKQRVRPGGKLLLVEAAPALTLLRSIRLLLRQPAGKRSCMLLLWAAVRSGKTLPEAFFKDDRWKPSCTSVLDGMVHVWLLERPAGLLADTSNS